MVKSMAPPAPANNPRDATSPPRLKRMQPDQRATAHRPRSACNQPAASAAQRIKIDRLKGG